MKGRGQTDRKLGKVENQDRKLRKARKEEVGSWGKEERKGLPDGKLEKERKEGVSRMGS